MEGDNQEKLSRDSIAKIIKKRNPDSHKGDYGKALLVVGSYGKIGASVLAAKACL